MESASIIRSSRGVPVLSIFVEQAEAGCAIDRTILDARDEERIRMFSNRWTRPGPSCANDRGHSSRRVATESSFSVLASLTTRTPWNNRSLFSTKCIPTFSLVSFRPLAYTVKVAGRRGRGVTASSLMPARVLIIPLLGRARLHGHVNVAGVGARCNVGRLDVGADRSMGGTRLATEVALQPLGRLEFSRLVLLLEVQRFPRQHVLPRRETLAGKAYGKNGRVTP